jgi:DNA-binding protein HU-beta
MNKSDLANYVAKRLHISHSDSLCYLNTLVEEVEAILARNEDITIQNFGTFSPWHQTARPGRNPKNGTIYKIPARTSVKFKPGKRMLEKLNPTLCAIACLLFLSVMTGCSSEQQPAIGEWVPVEVNIGDIEQIEVSPMGTKAWDTELPSIIKTKFNTGDEINLTYTQDGNPVTVSFQLKASGKWEKSDGTPFMLQASADNNGPVIKAEYGTPIPNDPGYNTADYLTANATTTYDATTKTYTCNFGQFKRPDDYLCLYIKIQIINTPTLDNGEPLYFIDAKFYTSGQPTPRFPIADGTIEVFYKGPFTAQGVCLTSPEYRYWDTELDIPKFDEVNNTPIEFQTGSITPVQLIIPLRP